MTSIQKQPVWNIEVSLKNNFVGALSYKFCQSFSTVRERPLQWHQPSLFRYLHESLQRRNRLAFLLRPWCQERAENRVPEIFTLQTQYSDALTTTPRCPIASIHRRRDNNQSLLKHCMLYSINIQYYNFKITNTCTRFVKQNLIRF